MLLLSILSFICGGFFIYASFFKIFKDQLFGTYCPLLGCIFLCTGFILMGISIIIENLKQQQDLRNLLDESVNSLQKKIDESIMKNTCELNESQKQNETEFLQENIRKFNSSGKFSFSEQEEILSTFKTAQDVYEYLVKLEIDDDFFKNTIIPEIEKTTLIEKYYGNAYTSAIKKLSELTNTECSNQDCTTKNT